MSTRTSQPAGYDTGARPSVPPPLSWKDASQIARWLLGRREHNKALRRRAFVPAREARSLADQFALLKTPWPVAVYPGAARWLAGVLDVKLRTAEALLGGRARLTERHARRMVSYLEASIARERAALEELREYVDRAQREAALHRNRGYVNGIQKWRREQAALKAAKSSQ